jgi:hypothetical protein
MPIDNSLLDAFLGTFRNMLEECKQRNFDNEHVQNMANVMQRMEQLGAEHSDVNAFSGQMAQENLYVQFSDFYAKALAYEQSKGSSSSGIGYDDQALLMQNIQALKSAVKSIEDGYSNAIKEAEASGEMNNAVEIEVLQNPQEIIEPILRLIELGEQDGMNFPDFLKIQIERGLDKAMEGAVATSNALEVEKEFVSVNPLTPYDLALVDEKLSIWNQLCQQSSFGVPQWKEWSLKKDDIERKYETSIIVFRKITSMWSKLIDDLAHWSLSYVSFAPHIEPWSMAGNPKEAVLETQAIQPGIFQQREILLKKYFDIDFTRVFQHPTFLWSVKYDYIQYSQEFVEFLIKQIYPLCQPFQNLPEQLIEQRANFHVNGQQKQDREVNPMLQEPLKRMQSFYDKKFGEGRFQQKYGAAESLVVYAQAWDLHSFSV